MTGRTIEIVEVSPRDGLQNEAAEVATADKLGLIARAIDAGVRRLEAASFVNPKRVPRMADAEAVMAAVPRDRGVTFIGLVLNLRGVERALAARCDEVNFVVASTDTFNRRNQGASVAETMEHWDQVADLCAADGIPAALTIATAFGCPFEGRVDADRVIAIAERAASGRALREIAIADTVGVGVPRQVTDLVGRLRAALPGTPVRCHFHNTRNTGYANAIAAVEAGADTLDASIGGIGGCPFAPAATGNIATEDLVYLLRGMDIETGLELERLLDAAGYVGRMLGRPAPGLLHRAGDFPGEAAHLKAAS